MPAEKKKSTRAFNRRALRADMKNRKKQEETEKRRAGKTKRSKGALSPLKWTLLIAATLIAVTLFVLVNLFTVQKVSIENNQLYDNSVISETVLNDDCSWNSLYVFLKYKFVRTEELPFIDSLDVSLQGPHELIIHVYEKGLMGYLYVENLDKNVYFDTEGFVTEISDRLIEGVPLVTGLDCGEMILYEKLPVSESILKDLLSLTQALKKNDLVPEEIIYGGEVEPLVSYGDIKIAIGSCDNITRKAERLASIFPKLTGEKGTLHLETWTEDTTSIVFDRE